MCLTDIAKRSIEDTEPIVALRAWLKNSSALLFLQTWGNKKNTNFKLNQMVQFRMKAADNRNYATPKKYIEETGAIGIISKSGRYGGTFAHSDIALNFCYWLSPEFQVYLMEEFQRLKTDEQISLGDPFNIKRFITVGSYSVRPFGYALYASISLIFITFALTDLCKFPSQINSIDSFKSLEFE